MQVAALPTDVTVKSLIVNLSQAKVEFGRRSAVRKLGLFGPAAEAAVPILQELLDDPALKYVVELALKRINGK